MTMHQRKRRQASVYGTTDFTAALAAREAALGLLSTPAVDVVDNKQASTPEPQPEVDAADDVSAQYGYDRVDAWGNRITSPRGWFGQYTIASWCAIIRARSTHGAWNGSGWWTSSSPTGGKHAD